MKTPGIEPNLHFESKIRHIYLKSVNFGLPGANPKVSISVYMNSKFIFYVPKK